MDMFSLLVLQLRNLIWGKPLLFFLLGVGVYLTFILRGVQFRYLWYGIVQAFKVQDSDAEGDISHFQSLMTSLAGAIGTGSIVGVSTGIAVGGLGALFWMWVTAFVGMATKYAESLLAVKYREVDHNGEMIGGPMEYIEKGLGWRWLAVLFAIFGMLAAIGSGNLVQVNSIGDALKEYCHIDPWVTGFALAGLTALVLMGGVKSIGNVAGVLVPVMALFYLGGGVIILITHLNQVPGAIALIFKSAFTGQAAVGGFTGSTVMMAFQMGVARSVFSNEAGLGISSIAAAAAKTDCPGRQAMIAMTGALMSTVIVCSITGLVIAVMGSFGEMNAEGVMLNGVALSVHAFSKGFNGGGVVVAAALVLFAYSTVIAWAYYGEKCFEYLFGDQRIFLYRVLFVLIVIPGCALDMEVVWNIADISNGLMAVPNLIALVALSGVIVKETDIFLKRAKGEALKQ